MVLERSPSTTLTIVVITHERPELCRRATESVFRALTTCSRSVDVKLYDSSQRPTRPEVDSVDYHHHPEHPSVSAKRKLAEQECETEWLVFLDDDCVMHEDAMTELLARADQAPEDVGAFFCNTRFTGERHYWFRCVESSRYMNFFAYCTGEGPIPWGTTNLSMFRTAALQDSGGFRTDMRTLTGGEDVDVCLRLRAASWVCVGIPKVLVDHGTETWNTFFGNLRRYFNYGRGDAELCALWPKYRLCALATIASTALATLLTVLIVWGCLGVTLLGFLAFIALTLVLSAGISLMRELVAHRRTKGPVDLAGLVLLRVVYRTGAFWHKMRFARVVSLFQRLDWERIWSLSDTRGSRFEPGQWDFFCCMVAAACIVGVV